MRFLDRFFRREKRADAPDIFFKEYLAARGLGGTIAPEAIESNLAVAARCVGLRSEMLSSVALNLYRRTDDGGREKAEDNPLFSVLHDNMNPNMTAFEGRELMIRDLDTKGNAFARIERNARGQVVALWPEPWMYVTIERLPSGRLRYRVTSPYTGSVLLTQDEVLHVRGPTRDGIYGLSPLYIARDSVRLAMSQAASAQSFTERSFRPSGIISFPDQMTQEIADRVRVQIAQRHQGPGRHGDLMIFDGGAKFEPFTFSLQDAEFLDSRKLANEDVARIFGVPPTVVGIGEKAHYNNLENEARALVQNALGPLAARIEGAMVRCLLSEASRRTYYIEHDLTTLLRGDIQARFEAYRVGREIGALSPNDIRRKENDPPIAGGDIYHQPANWVPLGTLPSQLPGGG